MIKIKEAMAQMEQMAALGSLVADTLENLEK